MYIAWELITFKKI